VQFDLPERQTVTAMGAADVQASFSEAGDYVVRMQTIDNIAAFEFYCCHTNAYFHINVVN
jgi:TRAP-type mannitol/chloroaromatic compound transport system substrate-binding protein